MPDGTTNDTTRKQDAARVGLGLMLVTAGASHLTFAREPFKAQVPPWLPIDPDAVVLQSGVVEIALGTALLCLPRHKVLLGRIAAVFFVGVFPGNIAQYTNHRNAFGLDTDKKRLARLFFQPVLIAWALWSTGWRYGELDTSDPADSKALTKVPRGRDSSACMVNSGSHRFVHSLRGLLRVVSLRHE